MFSMTTTLGSAAAMLIFDRPASFIHRLPRSYREGVDVLGSVLQELRFESTEYRSLRLGEPFRVSFSEPGLRGVHVVVEGECEVSVEGQQPRRLRAGDLVLFPRGDAHVLHSVGAVRGPSQSGVALAMATEPGSEVRGGGTGAETVIMCGAFVVTRHDHPALAGLPQVVHVTEGSGRERWLAPYIDALSAEVFHGGPGSGVVMARLSDALVARALRFHAEAVTEPGLLLGLRDPYVAPALAAMHDDLAEPWTVASLAAVAGCRGGVRRAFSAAGGDIAGWPIRSRSEWSGRGCCCATAARPSGRSRRRWDTGRRRRSPRRSSATPVRHPAPFSFSAAVDKNSTASANRLKPSPAQALAIVWLMALGRG